MNNQQTIRILDDIKQHINSFIIDGLTGGFWFDEESAAELQGIEDKLNYLKGAIENGA